VDEDTFERFCREHWQAILAYALRRTDSPADAADVVSEVFVVAWRRRLEIPKGDDERLWLFGVARHTLSNARRGGVRRSRLQARLVDAIDLTAPDPQDLAAERGEVEALLAALARLPDRDRQLLTLVGWDGLSPTAAAKVLGLRAPTARVYLHRARQRLRRAFDEQTQRSATSEPSKGNGRSPVPAKETT
jgi:RNA polymerase sigma factor (sigma-70 family)